MRVILSAAGWLCHRVAVAKRRFGFYNTRMAAQSYLRSSRVISVLTLVSRITGLLRDSAISAWLGYSWVQDRFVFAFTIPNLFRQLFGEGALSAVFIPVLTDRLSREGRDRAAKLFGNVISLLAALLIGLTVLVLLLLGGIWVAGERDAALKLTLGLTALMAPYMILICLVALFSALLNCLDRFGLPAFVPVIMNLFLIAGVLTARYVLGPWLGDQQSQVYVLGVALLLAGVTQLATVAAAVRRAGVRWSFDFSLSDPDVRTMFKMLAPLLLGLGVLKLSELIDNTIIVGLSPKTAEAFSVWGYEVAYPLYEGAMTAVNNARRLYQFPLGVLAISLATAAFPTFSRAASAKDFDQLRGSVSHALRIAILEGIPSGLGLILLAELIVTVVFKYGNVGGQDVRETAHVLRMYGLGLWAFCAQHIIVRAFYSVKDTKTPLKVMSATLVLNLAMNLTLIWVHAIGAGAFGLSASVMCSLNVVLLCAIFSRRYGRLEIGQILRATGKVAVAAGLMGAAVYATYAYFDELNRYMRLALCMGVAAGVFLPAAVVLKIEEFHDLVAVARKKRGR